MEQSQHNVMDKPFDLEVLAGALPLGHPGWLKLQLHAAGPDWIELAMNWREDLVGDPDTDVLASGPVLALMDNACGAALWMKRGKFGQQLTVDLRVDYMRPALAGSKIIARAEVYRMTRQVAFIRGIGYENDPADPVCNVAATFMYFDGKEA
ncbi:hypothetical protein BH10PSE13_BH10PSE13_17210 [soil metagenome]